MDNLGSMSLSVQEFTPSSCPPSGRYTGAVALGLGITGAGADRVEANIISVRVGLVRDGQFEGVRMTHAQQGVMMFLWIDSASGGGQIRRFTRSDANYSLSAARAALAEGLANSVVSDKAANQRQLEMMLQNWHDNPAGEMQRFTSAPHSSDFMNPHWIGLAGNASQPVASRMVDDPKARGRSARGG